MNDQRSSLRSTLGYAVRQKEAFLRVLEDGRLVLDNNRRERALRGTIATGRQAWLFVGIHDHAESAGHIFSLIASCRLHGLDPEAWLRDLFRVLANWPSDRYLELAPKYWTETRARLDPEELAREVGPLAVPPMHSGRDFACLYSRQDGASSKDVGRPPARFARGLRWVRRVDGRSAYPNFTVSRSRHRRRLAREGS